MDARRSWREVGARIRRRRETLGMCPQLLALLSGQTAGCILAYEHGSIAQSLNRMRAIAVALECRLSELCPEEVEPPC